MPDNKFLDWLKRQPNETLRRLIDQDILTQYEQDSGVLVTSIDIIITNSDGDRSCLKGLTPGGVHSLWMNSPYVH